MRLRGAVLALAVVVVSCATARAGAPSRDNQVGLASVYHDGLAGRPTASGAPYDPEAFTCAHRELRLGTRVEVYSLRTKRSAVCTVNDRGPFVDRRVIDLSKAMARELGILERGVSKVEVRVLE